MSVDWPGRANNLVIKLTVLENEHYFFWSFILKCYFCGSAGDRQFTNSEECFGIFFLTRF